MTLPRIFFALCLLLVPAAALADSVTLYGLSFPVENRTEVDKKSVQLTLFGQTRIVRREQLEDLVLSEYFARGPERAPFSTAQLRTFIEAAVADDKIERAAKALWLLLDRSGLDLNGQREAVDWVAGLDRGTEVLKSLFSSMAVLQEEFLPPQVLCVFLANIGRADREWLRSNAVSQVYRLGARFIDCIDEKFSTAVTDLRYEDAGAYVALADDVSVGDESGARKLKVIYNRMRDLIEAETKDDFEKLERLSDVKAGTQREDALLAPVVVSVLQRGAAKLLEAKQPERAIELLSYTPFERRTDSTHALLLQALETMPVSKNPALGSKNVGSFLARISEKDEKIKAAALAAYIREIEYLKSEGAIEQFDACSRQLFVLRPDPSKENDAVRFDLAIALAQGGAGQLSDAKLNEIQTGLTLSQRFALLKMRYAALNWEPFVFVIFFLLLALLWVRVSRRIARPRLRRPVAEVGPDPIEEIEGEVPRGFSMPRSARMLGPAGREYMECLQTFGLDARADLGSIKKAYRAAVKEFHPDLQGEADQDASNKFIAFTQTYERLLALRASLGIDEEE